MFSIELKDFLEVVAPSSMGRVAICSTDGDFDVESDLENTDEPVIWLTTNNAYYTKKKLGNCEVYDIHVCENTSLVILWIAVSLNRFELVASEIENNRMLY